MIQLEKQFAGAFRRNGGLGYEVFQLNGTENMMEWTNIAKTIAAKQDEEVWLELQFYRDQKHLDDLVAEVQKNENAHKIGKQFMDLLTPGSCIEGWFDHVNI